MIGKLDSATWWQMMLDIQYFIEVIQYFKACLCFIFVISSETGLNVWYYYELAEGW